MKMLLIRNYTFSILITGLLVACQSSPGPEKENVASEVVVVSADDELICFRERATGSHFSKKVCRTRAQIKGMRRETQEMIDSARPPSGPTSQ
jgi:hypothetical protein